LIKRLQNKNLNIAEKIRSVFQVSYAVEAKLLNAIDFPPLKRRLESYVECDNDFFGYLEDQDLAGVVEINHNDDFTHVQSLVVDPKFFRQGIAQKLMRFILNSYDTKLFIVETGVENKPAIALYEKFGFIEVKQWDTNHGVRKIKLELVRNSYA